MIGRLWSARTGEPAAARRYQDIFGDEVLGELSGLAGFRGGYLLRRDTRPGVEFVTLTLFDSLTAVRAFAGADPDRAAVSAPARAVLADFDQRVRHFTVVNAPELVRTPHPRR